MGYAFHVVVPVAVVEVGHAATGSQWQVVGILLYAFVIRQRLDENHLLLVGRELESFNVNVALCELSAVGAVGVHRPQLSLCEERDALAALYPCCVSLAGSGSGESAL